MTVSDGTSNMHGSVHADRSRAPFSKRSSDDVASRPERFRPGWGLESRGNIPVGYGKYAAGPREPTPVGR